jgi:hypothetical protein
MPAELFDPSPYTPNGDIRKSSPDARRTARNNADIQDGIHPVSGRRIIYVGATCGGCSHHGLQGGVAGRFHKCELNLTGGPATDIRVSWPACTSWEPAP